MNQKSPIFCSFADLIHDLSPSIGNQHLDENNVRVGPLRDYRGGKGDVALLLL